MQPRPDRRVFWLLERAGAAMRQRLERLAAERLETTAAQLPVIFHLASRAGEKGSRPGELAEALGVNAAAITGLTGRMEAAGVLRRKPAPDDGRAQLLSLTAAGRRIAERALPEVARLQGELLAGFSAEEIEVAMRFLRAVIERAPALGEPAAPVPSAESPAAAAADHAPADDASAPAASGSPSRARRTP
jgi:DNA-binding MarR family transcriptional regulator